MFKIISPVLFRIIVSSINNYSSVKYLQRYISEFCFRFNNRNGNIFDKVPMQAIV